MMISSRVRWSLAATLLILLFSALSVAAQDGVRVVGSGQIAPIITALNSNITVDVTGTTSGLAALCANEADVALATRPINALEEQNCTSLGVSFQEVLLGYDILALVSNPAATFAECLTTDELNVLFAPSAEGGIIDWSQVNPANSPAPITFALPTPDTGSSALLDNVVSGDGLRADATTYADTTQILAAIAADPNTIGALPLLSATQAGEAVRLLAIDAGTAGCESPSVETVESRAYGLSSPLYLYVNAASAANPDVVSLLANVAAGASTQALNAQGFVPPSEAVAARNAEAIANGTTGRVFSRDVVAFTIPANVFGTITVGGTSSASDYFTAVSNAFTTAYPSVTLTTTLYGEPEGFRRLCNGETDIALSFSGLNADQTANCTANNITVETYPLGREAAVLIANGGSAYLQCLTTAQLATVWSATGEATATTWDQVSADFPQTPITLFAPVAGSSTLDVLLSSVAGNTPDRADLQFNDDPLYRGAATANVDGALALLTWAEYNQIIENEQANVSLVAVDGGSGCITPSEATVSDSSYPLARPLNLLVNRAALARTEVQSLVWFLFSDDNYDIFANNDLIGVPFGTLGDLRFNLQDLFAQAQAEAISLLEATPEATGEATPSPDATDAVDLVPTAEMTMEMTAEMVDPAPTLEATLDVTVEATAQS